MKIIRVIILFLISVSCSKNDNEESTNQNRKIDLDKYNSSSQWMANITDTLVLNIDERSPLKSPMIQYLEKTNQLAIMNTANQSIDIYSFDSGELQKRLNLREEGPDGVGKVRSFYIEENREEIYVINQDNYYFYVLNYEAKVKNKVDFNRNSAPKVNITTWQPLIVSGPNVFMSSTPSRDYFKSSFYETNDLFTQLNLQSGEVNYFLSYPDEVKGKLWGPNLSSKYHAYDYINNNRMLVSWPSTASITIIDSGRIKNTKVVSEKINVNPQPVEQLPKDFKSRHMLSIKNSQYGRIFFDGYRKNIYRFAKEAVPEKYWDSNNFDEQNIHPFTIMVMDMELNLQKEIVFPHLEFYSFMSFVAPKGFYIMTIPETENKLTFYGFNFNK